MVLGDREVHISAALGLRWAWWLVVLTKGRIKKGVILELMPHASGSAGSRGKAPRPSLCLLVQVSARQQHDCRHERREERRGEVEGDLGRRSHGRASKIL